MKYNFLLFISMFYSSIALAQSQVNIDFDNDGIKDKANLITSEEGYKIEFSISSLGGQIQKTQTITLCGQENYLTVK